MPFVAIDSNVVDLLLDCAPTTEHTDAMEAMEEPPPFDGVDDPKLRRELLACFWLRAVAVWVWPGVFFTFSDLVYVETMAARRGLSLLIFATDIRERLTEETRTVDPDLAPGIDAVMACGVTGRADAEHLSDAIGMGCDVFLTNDDRLRRKSPAIEDRWDLRLRRPAEFLVEAVRDDEEGWPEGVRWPWEQLDDY